MLGDGREPEVGSDQQRTESDQENEQFRARASGPFPPGCGAGSGTVSHGVTHSLSLCSLACFAAPPRAHIAVRAQPFL
ncbi:hypothetical protein GCM10025762_45630 [Haloechinothrix salitolerans]